MTDEPTIWYERWRRSKGLAVGNIYNGDGYTIIEFRMVPPPQSSAFDMAVARMCDDRPALDVDEWETALLRTLASREVRER